MNIPAVIEAFRELHATWLGAEHRSDMNEEMDALASVLGLDPHSLEAVKTPDIDPTFSAEHYLFAEQILGHLSENLALHFQVEGETFDRPTMMKHIQKRHALGLTRELLLDEGERLLQA